MVTVPYPTPVTFGCTAGVVPFAATVEVAVTVTLALVAAMPAALLAVIVAAPAVMPVTVSVAVVWPTPNVAVAGTVAMLVLLELRLTVRPPVGAAPDNVRVKVPVPAPPMIVRLDGE